MQHGQPDRRYYFEIFLVSFAALLLEISYTRIFSFKIYYFFTYLIIGMALLGIGSGGIFVSVFERLRRKPLPDMLALCAFLGGLAVGVGYFVIALVPVKTLHAYEDPNTLIMLGIMSLTLYAAYLCIGLIIARLFVDAPDRINRLYFVDLVGAGLACAVVVPLINSITPPGCVFLAGLVLALAGFPSVRGRGAAKLAVCGAAILFLAAGALTKAFGVDVRVDLDKTLATAQAAGTPMDYSKWGAVFRLDVSPIVTNELRLIANPNLTQEEMEAGANRPQVRLNNHDGMAGSAMLEVKGDIHEMKHFDSDERSIPFSVVQPAPSVLIIGAAGGHEIIASVYFGASRIEGVELNPLTYNAIRGPFADYTGRVVERPEVHYVNDEGRSYLAQQPADKKYDLIYFVAPDSYAAMNAATAGAFVMAESYLYTVEAIQAAYDRLSPGGFLCMQFGEFNYAARPNRTLRYLVSAREALRRSGVPEFDKHILLGTSHGILGLSTILLKKDPVNFNDAVAFREQMRRLKGGAVHFAGGTPPPSPAATIITASDADLKEFIANYPYNITPVRDDSPFFWHFVRFRDLTERGVLSEDFTGDYEDAYGEQVLVLLFGLAVALGAVFLLLPLVAIRQQWMAFQYKGRSFVYFAALGLGFMFFEIALIQKLTLFLGYPTYSLTVTLMAVLVFSGVGSMISERYVAHARTVSIALAAVLVVLAIFFGVLADPLLRGGVGAPLAWRIGATIFMVAPVGLALGAFLPLGLAIFPRTSQHREQYIAWCWAINGFFSVMGSILAALLSMAYGFRALMFISLAVYLVAVVCLLTVASARSASARA